MSDNLKAAKIAAVGLLSVALFTALLLGTLVLASWLIGSPGIAFLVWIASVIFGSLFLAARLDLRDQRRRGE